MASSSIYNKGKTPHHDTWDPIWTVCYLFCLLILSLLSLTHKALTPTVLLPILCTTRVIPASGQGTSCFLSLKHYCLDCSTVVSSRYLSLGSSVTFSEAFFTLIPIILTSPCRLPHSEMFLCVIFCLLICRVSLPRIESGRQGPCLSFMQ